MSEPQPFAHPQPVYCCKMKVDAAPEVYTGGQEGGVHCWGFDAASGGFATELTRLLEQGPPLLFEWANEAKPLVKAWAKALLRAAAKSDAPSARD